MALSVGMGFSHISLFSLSPHHTQVTLTIVKW